MSEFGTFRTLRDARRESGMRVKPDIIVAFPRDIIDAIGAAEKFGGFLDRAAGLDRGLEMGNANAEMTNAAIQSANALGGV
jgi:hypothetical protein